MPIQLTIHGDNKGNIAETIVINNYGEQKPRINQTIEPAEEVVSCAQEPTAIDYTSLEKYLAFTFYDKRKEAYSRAIEMIISPDYSDREKAYFAYQMHTTPGILKTNIKEIKLFAPWYREFCRIFNLQHHEEYTPNKIAKPSEEAKKFDSILQEKT